MLVVIAIIAILAGLLMPALAAARAKAREAGCRSNLKQMALFTFMYADDNDGWAMFRNSYGTMANYDDSPVVPISSIFKNLKYDVGSGPGSLYYCPVITAPFDYKIWGVDNNYGHRYSANLHFFGSSRRNLDQYSGVLFGDGTGCNLGLGWDAIHTTILHGNASIPQNAWQYNSTVYYGHVPLAAESNAKGTSMVAMSDGSVGQYQVSNRTSWMKEKVGKVICNPGDAHIPLCAGDCDVD